jgi:hypothetical protein
MASIGGAYKVNGAVSTSTQGAYTAPANGFAILTIGRTQGGAYDVSNVSIGGRVVGFISNVVGGGPASLQVYVGPSQNVTWGVPATGTISAVGVEFINS